MRQKLEQQEAAKLREEKLLQEKLREERKKMEQMYADEKVRHGDGGSSSGRRHKVKQHIDHSDLLDGINDASDASDLERINLKSYSAAMASAHDSDSVLKALSASDSDEISLKSLSHSLSHSDPSAKFFKQHPELLDDSLTTSSLSSLRPSSHLSSSALESSIRPSFGSLSHSSLLSPKSLHGRPHGHINYGMPNFGPGFGSAHAASSISPSFGPKFPPPFMSPFMPGPPMRGPRPMPGGPMPGFPGRPFAPGMSPFPGSMGSFGSASSLSPARFPPPPPMSQSSLHSIAASMYPSLYPNGNPHQRSSPLLPNSPITIGSSPASTTGSATTAATEGDKKDPKTGKKLKSMLMDFAVSSILDVGMLNLMGNILGKMNAEPGT